MRPCLVYLSGPITARHGFTIEENVASALNVYWQCLKANIPAFCPHLSATFPTAHVDIPYETWMAFDFAVIARCTHILMLPRWGDSDGAKRELAYAVDCGLPVFYSVANLEQSL